MLCPKPANSIKLLRLVSHHVSSLHLTLVEMATNAPSGAAGPDDAAAEPSSEDTYVRAPWWKRNLAVPVMLGAMFLRIYWRLSSTTSAVLLEGETPRPDDVLIASVPGSSEALAAVMQAAANMGTNKIPSLELGSTRRNFATSRIKPLAQGFWLDREKAKQLDMARRAVQSSDVPSIDLRLFTSWQPFDIDAMAPSSIQKSNITNFSCPTEMAPYACLCVNCAVRWSTIVYVVEGSSVAGCRTYGLNYAKHVESYVKAPDAAISRFDIAADTFVDIRTPSEPLRHILFVLDDDVRAAPDRTAAAVFAWILDMKYQDRPAGTLDNRYFQVDSETLRRRVRYAVGDRIRSSTITETCSDERHDLAPDIARLLGMQ